MRGISILCICLHNWFHVYAYTKECEYSYDAENIHRLGEMLTSGKLLGPLEDVLSFFGWYGIATFIFLSGFGLVWKHEKGEGLQPGHYLWRNYLKLFLLIAPYFLLYVVVLLLLGRPILSLGGMLLMMTMTSNFLMPERIDPGVYWYMGLTLQLYIVYLLFYYKRSGWWLVGVSVAMWVAGTVLAVGNSDGKYEHLHFFLRHNAPLWLPVMAMGIWVAREKELSFLEKVRNHPWTSLLLVTLLFVATSVTPWLWTFSPLLFVVMMLIVAWRWRSPLMAYLGKVSAGIFVAHPIVRIVGIELRRQWDPVITYLGGTLAYLLLSILLGIAIQKIYNFSITCFIKSPKPMA